jgi:hypothetical protein
MRVKPGCVGATPAFGSLINEEVSIQIEFGDPFLIPRGLRVGKLCKVELAFPEIYTPQLKAALEKTEEKN